MPPGVTIESVSEPARHSAFLRLPAVVNAGDPDWVPPLRMAVRKLLDTRRYPFFEHGKASFFVARRDGQAVGRIAAITNRLHEEHREPEVGFFGFFECEDDVEAARALVRTAAGWVHEQGCRCIRGPLNYSLNDEAPGVLVEGRNGPPVLLMAHNPAYYGRLLEQCGLHKAKDLYAWLVTEDIVAGDRFLRIARALARRAGDVETRLIRTDRSGFRNDVETMLRLFNTAWADNWGFVPVTPKETDAIAADLKPILRPELTNIAMIDGEPVAFMVCVPNLNEVLLQIPDGRLFPFGWYKLLTGLRKVRGFRTMLMGVLPEHRGRGIDGLMISNIIQAGFALNQKYCELSWVLEDNTAMNSLAEKVGALRYRTYRLYEADVHALCAE